MAVRFNPNLYKQRTQRPDSESQSLPPLFQLPHRVIFAIASLQTVHIYDTAVSRPLAVVQGLHCAEITDLTWSRDGTKIIVSSRDGFCSLIRFAADEFGELVPENELPTCMQPIRNNPMAAATSSGINSSESISTSSGACQPQPNASTKETLPTKSDEPMKLDTEEVPAAVVTTAQIPVATSSAASSLVAPPVSESSRVSEADLLPSKAADHQCDNAAEDEDGEGAEDEEYADEENEEDEAQLEDDSMPGEKDEFKGMSLVELMAKADAASATGAPDVLQRRADTALAGAPTLLAVRKKQTGAAGNKRRVGLVTVAPVGSSESTSGASKKRRVLVVPVSQP